MRLGEVPAEIAGLRAVAFQPQIMVTSLANPAGCHPGVAHHMGSNHKWNECDASINPIHLTAVEPLERWVNAHPTVALSPPDGECDGGVSS